MKKRVSVYIDEGVWEWTKEKAWELRISASALFEKLVRGEIAFGEHVTVEESMEVVRDTAISMADSREHAVKKRVAESIGIDLKEAQAKVDKVRKERGIKDPEWAGGYPKSHQARKKGAK